MKLCIIYNFAAHYRASVFTKIDKYFDCDWYFGPKNDDIKHMDYSLLNGKVTIEKAYQVGPFYYQKGVPSLVLNNRYDTYLLFATTKSFSVWLFLLLSKLYPKKLVFLWTHGFYGKETFFERCVKKILFKLPNGGTFVYGNYSRNLMIKNGIDPQKVYTIHNSLAYEGQIAIRNKINKTSLYSKHFKNNYPILLFVGRLTKIKKLDLILQAMSLLKQRGHLYNLVMIGDGIMKNSLMSMTKEMKLDNSVWFYGPCYDESVLGELIYNADLCVSPGNVGLTAMHSMVFGTPVITHNDFPHQMPEFEAITEGKTGSFFAYDNVNDLANHIYSWFNQKSYDRDTIRKNCYEEIDNYWTPDFQLNVLKEVLKK